MWGIKLSLVSLTLGPCMKLAYMDSFRDEMLKKLNGFWCRVTRLNLEIIMGTSAYDKKMELLGRVVTKLDP